MHRSLPQSAGAALLVLCSLSGCTQSPPLPKLPPPVVTVCKPVERDIVESLVFTGRTEGSEFVEVRARVSGYLSKVDFKSGTLVKEGATLFEIDARPYKAALDQAEADNARAEAHVKRLSADAERARVLLSRNAIAREDYDKAVGDLAEATAGTASTKATVDRKKLDLGWTKVTAPLSGMISRDLINVGNLVTADHTKLTTIVKLDPIYVYFDIDENTVLRILAMIRTGKFKSARESRVPVAMALANDTGFPRKGFINFVENQLDPNTGTMRVRASFENPPQPNGAIAIPAGNFARVQLELGEPRKTLLVTDRAVMSEQSTRYVYIVNAKGEVERREVQVGIQDGGLRAIEAGLAPDDRVIVNGMQRARQGIEVDAKDGPMPGTGPIAPAPKAS